MNGYFGLLLDGDLASSIALGIGGLLAFLVAMAVAAVFIVALWKVFTKAGHPGWASLIPFYNSYILLKIAGRPGWWLVLFFVPLVNLAIAIVLAIDIAKAFGQSSAFGFFLLFLLCGIGYLMLGFGDYRYVGPQAAGSPGMAMA